MYQELLQNCLMAAGQGAITLRENIGKVSQDQIDEKGVHDFVTEIDRKSEVAIIDVIKTVYPDHSILAEESGYKDQKSEFRWIIDPLDGTTNFIHSYPAFAVSVGVQHRGDLVAGVVVDITRDEVFSAGKGMGAFLNGKKIEVSTTRTLDKSLVLTGFPFKAQKYLEDFITVFRELLPATSGLRRAGSAALDLAHVACGRADGFWEFGLSAWDIAAGALLVKEAGGVITDIELGEDYLSNGHVLCGNPIVHKLLNETIMKHFPTGHFVE